MSEEEMTECVVFDGAHAQYLIINDDGPVVLAENESIYGLMSNIESLGRGSKKIWPLNNDPETLSRALLEQGVINRWSEVVELVCKATTYVNLEMRLSNKVSTFEIICNLCVLLSLLSFVSCASAGQFWTASVCALLFSVFLTSNIYIAGGKILKTKKYKNTSHLLYTVAHKKAEDYLDRCNSVGIYYCDLDPDHQTILRNLKKLIKEL